MPIDLQAALAEHRPALLRHCYRMLGSFAEAEDLVQDSLERAWKARADYRGDAPLERWLFTIATNACLNALVRQRRRLSLPQLDGEPAGSDFVIGELEPWRFITPIADGRIFPDPAEVSESRATIALAFVALLQRVPPKQRAALLMKDVMGWPADEIAEALGLSVSSVNSALNRGRKAIARPAAGAEEPPPATVRDFVRAWERRDSRRAHRAFARRHRPGDAALPDVVSRCRRCLGVPPIAAIFDVLVGGIRLAITRANGLPTFAFHRIQGDGTLAQHSIMVARFLGGRVAEMTVFVGPSYFSGFEGLLPLDRTVSGASIVMKGKGDRS